MHNQGPDMHCISSKTMSACSQYAEGMPQHTEALPQQTYVQETALLQDFNTFKRRDQLTCCSKVST